MKILAVDTSSKNASVAILENQNVLLEINNDDEKTHSQKLMPMIDEAFQKTSLSLDNIDLISCCLGPGSFTGVRIGIATCKAFADSKNIALTGVSSLEALAYNTKEHGIVCSLINANNGNVYAGIFEIVEDNNILQIAKSKLDFLCLKNSKGEISFNNLLDFINNFSSNCSNISFVGDGAVFYEDLLKDLCLKNNLQFKIFDESYCKSTGISIGKIGYTKYKNGNYGNSDFISPIYLRKSQAEIALEEKLNKKDI
ncbi:MAG: tRNA (adenosine(37)-N6)-threonylcarbamoyltransferase complex dimerization subunit type 1 TsaB [Clostridia bacterium]